jgi:hypothetical protein
VVTRAASGLAARRGRRRVISIRVPPGDVSIANVSISRRAPGMPAPSPAAAGRSPDRMAATSGIPGPRSTTVIASAPPVSPSPNATVPPDA